MRDALTVTVDTVPAGDLPQTTGKMPDMKIIGTPVHINEAIVSDDSRHHASRFR